MDTPLVVYFIPIFIYLVYLCSLKGNLQNGSASMTAKRVTISSFGESSSVTAVTSRGTVVYVTLCYANT